MERNARFELTVHSFLPTMETGSGHETHLCIPLRPVMSMVLRDIPKLIDESTSSLDPVMRDDILDMLLDFVQDEEHGVLFSTHITSDLSKIADYIAFLHKGRLLFYKSKDELIYHYGLIHCGENLFRQISQDDRLAWRKQDYEYQILVADRDAMAKKYKDCVIDPATLDDIMLLYIRGETV